LKLEGYVAFSLKQRTKEGEMNTGKNNRERIRRKEERKITVGK
jgi:hypothetical protein